MSWDPQLVRCKEEEEEEGVSGRPEGERGRVARPREERRPLVRNPADWASDWIIIICPFLSQAFSGQVVERVTPTATMSATDSVSLMSTTSLNSHLLSVPSVCRSLKRYPSSRLQERLEHDSIRNFLSCLKNSFLTTSR